MLVAVGMFEDVEGVAECAKSLPVDASGVALFFAHVALLFATASRCSSDALRLWCQSVLFFNSALREVDVRRACSRVLRALHKARIACLSTPPASRCFFCPCGVAFC